MGNLFPPNACSLFVSFELWSSVLVNPLVWICARLYYHLFLLLVPRQDFVPLPTRNRGKRGTASEHHRWGARRWLQPAEWFPAPASHVCVCHWTMYFRGDPRRELIRHPTTKMNKYIIVSHRGRGSSNWIEHQSLCNRRVPEHIEPHVHCASGCCALRVCFGVSTFCIYWGIVGETYSALARCSITLVSHFAYIFVV